MISEEERVMLELYQAWQVFRTTHNLQDAKIACCERTQRLFNALYAYEEMLKTEQDGRPH